MATRQYIGARYVPKFFQGPDGTPTWVSGIPYEPLTIVTYLGSSYTSKIPVPVGIDILNTEYWALTGNYNAQVEDYRQAVEKVKSDLTDETTNRTNADTNLSNRIMTNTTNITTNTNNIASIQSKINILSKRRMIFISDSYGDSTNRPVNWISKVIPMLGLQTGDYYIGATGGFGFHPSYNAYFISLIKNLASQVQSPNTITDIVVGGGFNDRGQPVATLLTAIQEFCSYCKQTYPNARIWIGAFGWSFNFEFVAELNNGEYIQAYKQCSTYGAIYIDGSNYVMHPITNFNPEPMGSYNLFLGQTFVHPNEKGAQLLADCVYSNLMGGSFNYDYYQSDISITPGTGVTIPTTMKLRQWITNDTITCFLSGGQITFSSPVTTPMTAYVEIGTVSSGCVAGASISGVLAGNYSINAFIAGGDTGGNKLCPVTIAIANNRLYAQVTHGGSTYDILFIINAQWTLPNIFA